MLMASSPAFHMAFRPPSMTINRAVPPDHPLLSFSSSRRRHRRLSFLPSKCHALRASSSSVSSVNPGATEDSIMLTYLEGNSWLWNFEGVKALVDPILVGNLDFGVPWLYDASKKVLTSFRIEDVPELDCLLITQSLDDHCHIKTLKPLAEMFPDLPVFSTPNAEFILSPLFKNVLCLEPGQSCKFQGKKGTQIDIFATKGPILGPPWQRPENGYIITSRTSNLNLYYEPHCVYDKLFLQNQKVDIVITPVIKQMLSSFTLVSGQEDAVQLAKILQAKYIVPMNSDLNSKGILSSVIQSKGTVKSFMEILMKELPGVLVLEPKPGVPLEIPKSSVAA